MPSWFFGGAGVPAGTIVMWSGSVASIPSGWALCNGSNGTPDLRDKFVVGAGTTYSVDDTGGAATHTLTTNEMPAHTHGLNNATLVARNTGFAQPFIGSLDDTNGSTSTLSMNSSGGGEAHNNLPPYHALAYIMKL